ERLARSEDLHVVRLLITHGHPDHIEGVARARSLTGASVHAHALERDAVRARLIGSDPVDACADGDRLDIGDLRVTVLHTPGHTAGAVCYLVEQEGRAAGALFTGDTLFIGRCGRTDFPGSDPDAMYRSLRRLASLPPETEVYPGHDY